jgi:hypothetical protein
MTKRLAVAIVHGIGAQDPDFAAPIEARLRTLFGALIAPYSKDPQHELVVKPVYWAPALQRDEDLLRSRLGKTGRFDYKRLRNFMINFAADAIAYQPTGDDRQAYAEIHRIFAATLSHLALEAGDSAPLAIIAHSLGTVITSNYLYDLQNDAGKNLVPVSVKAVMGDTPLEWGETLAFLCTAGSPIALWSLRYHDFGTSIEMPHPHFAEHYPKVLAEWLNFYDKDDVIGYPLKGLNETYAAAVTEDRQVNVGRLLSFWNPTSHSYYLEDRDVILPIADSLARIWKEANAIEQP